MADAGILHFTSAIQKEEDANESSIVLFAKIGGLTWLFTGDASESVEQELMRSFPKLTSGYSKSWPSWK